MVRMVDNDVVIIAISFFHLLNVGELWIAFGTGSLLIFQSAKWQRQTIVLLNIQVLHTFVTEYAYNTFQNAAAT